MSSNALTKLQSENFWKLRTAIINRPLRLQFYYLPQKRAPVLAFCYKTCAKTQQVLPVQTDFYRYDE